jgi:predicted dehydrogenase
MKNKCFRWGILGAAEIARKNWKAIRNSQNGIVTVVASRDLERSRAFVAGCQAATPFAVAPRAVGRYEDVIAADDVDGVYIPLPTGVRKEWVLRAAAAGKHIVCEKPCAVSVPDLAEMLAACRRHRVQFMDDVMFMHGGRLARIGEVLRDGRTVGAIRRINAAFSFNAPPEFFHTNIRGQSRLEPHGCLGDLGWYCIRFILWAMNWRLPQRVWGRAYASLRSPGSPAPVVTDFSGELEFGGGVSAGFYCSFLSRLQQYANISGADGWLHVPDFVLPGFGCETVFETGKPEQEIIGCDFNMHLNVRRWSVAEYGSGHPHAQESNLFRRFAKQAQSGVLDKTWPDMALKTQQVMEACRKSSRAGGKAVELRPGR